MTQGIGRRTFFVTLIVMEAGLLLLAVGLAWWRDVSLATAVARSTQPAPLIMALVAGLLGGIVPDQLGRVPALRDTYRRLVDSIVGFRLRLRDCVVMSLLAGVCEEALFRGVLQPWWGLLPTSIVFLLIHGYFDPRDWRKTLIGLTALPMSLIAGLLHLHFGLLPAMVFHFAYDLAAYVLIMRGQSSSIQAPAR